MQVKDDAGGCGIVESEDNPLPGVFADDIVLIADSNENLLLEVTEWEAELERKGIWGKNRVM